MNKGTVHQTNVDFLLLRSLARLNHDLRRLLTSKWVLVVHRQNLPIYSDQ